MCENKIKCVFKENLNKKYIKKSQGTLWGCKKVLSGAKKKRKGLINIFFKF